MMKKSFLNLLLILSISAGMLACGSGQSKIDEIKAKTQKAPVDPMTNWKTNKGVGPIQSVDISADIDADLVVTGQKIYETMCTACHKVDKKFIGPSPKDILSRRTPEWIMNMILNPVEMVQKDPIAKQLLIEANGAPMANQNLSEEDARAVLEYFRSL